MQEFIAAEHFDKPKTIVKLSDYVMRQQDKLLEHVIRADRMDPLWLPTIDSNLNTPGVFTKRTDKPRLHWVKENCKWVYKSVLEKDWPEDASLEHDCITEIVNAAMEDRF